MKTLKSLIALGALAGLFAGCETHDHATATAGAKAYPLKTCIVSGEKLDSMGQPVVKVFNGQEIKFCCNDCVKDFDKDPQKFLTKLNK